MSSEPIDLSFEGPAGHELRDLRTHLMAAGYTTGRVRDLLRIAEPVEEILSNAGRYSFFFMDTLEQSKAREAVLFQLFLFGGRVPIARFEQLDRTLVALLRKRGFVVEAEADPGRVRGTVTITELRERLFLSDQIFRNHGGEFVVAPGSCMPPHASSIKLADALRPPPHASSFLDVGCGSGCQSILAAKRYSRITGFDVDPRSVEFARANAVLNGVEARYAVGDCASFSDGTFYDHIAFNGPNTPNGHTAFMFINEGMERVLAPAGSAQVWGIFDIAGRQETLEAVLRHEIRDIERLEIDIAIEANSPFALSRSAISTRTPPRHTLLIDHPSKRKAYFDDLAARGVVEIICAVLTIRRRGRA